MKKKFLVLQPPLVDFFTLLVDDINDNETYGNTTDLDKCEYNRGIIDQMGLDMDFKIQLQTSLSDKGITALIPLGRYIAVYKVSKDETEQELYFFDHLSKVNFREQNEIHGLFSENIVAGFEKIQALIRSEFTDEDDIVKLELVE